MSHPKEKKNPAPRGEGVAPRWTSSAKDGAGTAIDRNCRLWFTVSHGIVNEVYHPFVDQANTRDMGLIVAGPGGFFSEEKRDTTHEITPIAPGVPGYQIVNTCTQGRFRITKTIFADPHRDVLLQRIEFTALQGKRDDYRVYILLAPHVGNQGAENSGGIGNYKGLPLLTAHRAGVFLALGASAPWRARSVGYVAVNDGWTQLHDGGALTEYTEAGPGNIALTGEIDLAACDGVFTLALAFGGTAAEAGLLCRTSLQDSFDILKAEYINRWNKYQRTCLSLKGPSKAAFPMVPTSIAVLKTHEGKRVRGASVASLSLPWGESKGDSDVAGYHVIWPRDQTEAAGAQVAVGDFKSARETLCYLMATQEPDGHWPQNMWIDGKPYWDSIQADETAFPILLVGLLQREKALGDIDPWPMVRAAATFLLHNGPSTKQDRWEANAGFSTFTVAAIIAALLVAAEMADQKAERDLAAYLRETADCWNGQIETWMYATGTELAKQVGVEGYYVRIAPPDVAQTGTGAMGKVPLANKPPMGDTIDAAAMISPDALALVRFGLRAPDDPHIRSTIKAIDATLRAELATGPGWHRYTHDGYGEHPDGSPYTGHGGLGRCWPLLAGERAHYELTNGNKTEAERLLGVMAAQTSAGGMLPEQVWDGDPVPKYELTNGHPSGSGMPLVWAHAEFLKLVRSLKDGNTFDTPHQALDRYRKGGNASALVPWRFDLQSRALPTGKKLRVETAAAATVHWSGDGWKTAHDTPLRETPVGLLFADLPTDLLPAGATVDFTFHWAEGDTWEGQNFAVAVEKTE